MNDNYGGLSTYTQPTAGTVGWYSQGYGQDANSLGNISDSSFNAKVLANTGNKAAGSSWLGKDGYLNTGAQVASGLSDLWGAYTGYQGVQQAKDEFEYNKALQNANLANQADLINESRLNSTNVGLALAGSSMNDAQKQAARDTTISNNVARTV